MLFQAKAIYRSYVGKIEKKNTNYTVLSVLGGIYTLNESNLIAEG